MDEIKPRFKGAIVLSLVLAFILMILPLKEEWLVWRPEWLALTLIHWGLVSPQRSSLLLAWFIGLLVDAVYGSILGQHALGYSIVLYMTLRMRPRVISDNFFQQIFIVFIVLGTYLLINLWILGVTGHSPKGWSYWWTVASSLVVWPIYHYFLQVFHYKKKPFQ